MRETSDQQRSPVEWAGVAARGLAMGIAEVVPGVSGGTIAFISGIYDELLRTLAGLTQGNVLLAIRAPVQFWQAKNLTFLLVLGAGMLLGVALFAHAFRLALLHYPPVVWSFFFGLIAATVLFVGRQLPLKQLLPLGLVGAGVGWLVGSVEVASSPGLLSFFLGGALAVSAWLLPAVSGSFLLLALGLYEAVLTAISELDWQRLAALALGCGFGLLAFARMLSALMLRYRQATLSVLVGFMVGALPRLWPWRLDEALLTPVSYAQQTGQQTFLLASLVSLTLGVAALWGLGRLQPKQTD